MKRSSKLILAGIGVALFVIVAPFGGLWLAVWYAMKPFPARRPPLADGLPRAFRDADRVFSNRVLDAFPLGSPEAALVRTLDAQGFQRRETDGYRQSSFVQQAFPCRSTWSIAWKADDHGRITEIRAAFSPVCL
jgi:hypothetical protein